MENDLAFLPNKLVTKLNLAGIKNLYELITYFPTRIQNIKTYVSGYPEEKSWYIANFILEKIEIRKKIKPYYLLTGRIAETGNQIQIYWFAKGNWVFKFLEENQQYQVLMKYYMGFWNLQKLNKFNSDQLQSEKFILGKCILKDYLLPVYTKIGVLQNSDLLQTHQLLDDQKYILNLQGLAPRNVIFPEFLSLSQIHKPKNLQTYLEAQKSWFSLQTYLKLALYKYNNQQESYANELNLDLEFLQTFTKNLPFELSISQKKAIWEILQDLQKTS